MARRDTSSMSRKRSRTTYETDPTSFAEAPFVFAGTALPSTDASAEYGPSNKHAAPDRTRLHGAFTGGWSAGYFNTVGSKEGWAPSHFTSSRSNRHKYGPSQVKKSLPQDFMDEEDLAEAKDNQRIDIAGVFGAECQDGATDRLQSLMHMRNETMGVLLLKKMGWKDGQGVGAKIRRRPRGDPANHPENHRSSRTSQTQTAMDSYSFAPDDIAQISLSKYLGRVGLGFRQSSPQGQIVRAGDSPKQLGRRREVRSVFGARPLNDSSSDEDVSQGLGPKLRYQSAKDMRKKIPGRASLSLPGGIRAKGNGNSIRQNEILDRKNCLPGFLVGGPDPLCSISHFEQLDISCIPPSWAPLQQGSAKWASVGSKSSIGGDKQSLPYPAAGPAARISSPMTSETRNALFASPTDSHSSLVKAQPNTDYTPIPHPSKEVAEAALARDREGRGPYRPDAPKRARYQQYLEHYSSLNQSVPSRPPDMSIADFTQELVEFERCARIFGPMAASMASRFTSASPATTTSIPKSGQGQLGSSATRDTATEAAMSGMFGPLTRSTFVFNPAQLLCKRFNVRPPTMDTRDDDARPDTVSSHTPMPMPTPAFAQPVVRAEDKPTIVTPILPPDQVFSSIFGGDSDDDTA